MKKLVVFIMAAAMFIAADSFCVEMSDLMPVLRQVKKDINSTLSGIDKDLAIAAKGLSTLDFKSDEARKILNDLRESRPYVIGCSIVNVDGILITVEPEEYRKHEDTDINGLLNSAELLKMRSPSLSNAYTSGEGVNVVSAGYPIFSDRGVLLGGIRMLIKKEIFLKPLAEGKPCKVWVMQPSGLVVYDPDPAQVGKNIFTDPLYKSFDDLISFSKTVALSPNGAGSYDFYAVGLKDKTLVKKVAVWDTVGLHGTEWRVVAMEIDKPIAVESKEPAKDIKAQ